MKKKTTISICISIFAVILISVALFIVKTHKPKNIFAFYNLPDKTKNAVLTVIKHTAEDFEIIDLDSSIPLSKQTKSLKKATLVFTNTDSDIIDYSLSEKKVLPISKDYSAGMPVSIKNTLREKQNGYSLIPFLYDMYQADINYNYLKQTSQLNINSWNDLIKLAKAERQFFTAPVTLTFKSDKEFLNIFGQIFEALSTYSEYEKFYAELYEAYKKDAKDADSNYKNCTELVNSKLEADYSLKNTATEFSQMMNDKLINSTSLNYQIEDTMFQCDNELTGIIFFKLSDHRNIAREVIGHYRSIYVPSIFLDDDRKFVANEYSVMMLNDNEITKQIISNIVENMQNELATVSGLSPVQKNCSVPDRQADDVRYWLAASSGPLLPLSAALPDPAAQAAIANILRGQMY